VPGGPPLIHRSGASPLVARIAPALLALAAAAACSGGSSGPLVVTPPSPATHIATVCDALHAALPRRLDGRPTTPVAPKSALTAAWGNPAVVLRCGVGEPATLRPTSETIEINGVRWFLHETKDAYVFTTYGRAAFVEVRVPKSVPREQATAPLVDLARPLLVSVPVVA
jgi:Protein of unknown function (DUF3515)